MILKFLKGKVRFDRQELSGSFGDIGTDFPLIVSMILIGNLDPASVLIMFGVMQILTGLLYGIPMPVQPLKAMAVIVITQRLSGSILYGGGLAIGITMLFLVLTGLIAWIAKVVPKNVVRGIQFGLGLQLAILALKDYVPSQGLEGYVLAGISFLLIIFFLGNSRYPVALLVISLGLVYAFTNKIEAGQLVRAWDVHWPRWHVPRSEDILTGFVVLALPQISLSIGNSVLATEQLVKDFFPHRAVSVRKIGLTYSFMNLLAPFFSGVPVCHGSGGIAGHYTFGARTGGSVVIYGSIYLFLGLFLSGAFREIIELFPKPILGVILLFEGWALMRTMQEVKNMKTDISIILLIGLIAVGLPYGYVIGLIGGTLLAHLVARGKIRLSE